MLNTININPDVWKRIVYIVLVLVTLAVYWQVNHYDFVNFDDDRYITQNTHVLSGVSLDTVRWAFSTTDVDGMWHPLIWLSFMFDHQLFGLKAGGYHLTNLFLHILSALLLFWFFNRMTHAIWPSAFVASLFAFHPLHVESVAWVSERKDVLSAFFWMLTLCLYVYYTEKPVIKRYLPVLFSFFLALMSKPMVVTLPLILILLDYWPLGRLQSQRVMMDVPDVTLTAANREKIKKKSKKGNLKENMSRPDISKGAETEIARIIPLWQLKEKALFLVLSAFFSIITFCGQQYAHTTKIPLSSRLANVPVSFVTYLEKTFLPHAMTVFYPFPAHIPVWQIVGASLLILVITIAAIVTVRDLPSFFTGWFWFAVTIAPVSGIIQSGEQAMADRYHYLPSIGIAVGLAWGIPFLVKSEAIKRKILFPAGITFLAVMTFLSWQQCHYWRDSFGLWNHALSVTKDNYLARDSMGQVLFAEKDFEKAIDNFNASISIAPDNGLAYYNRGTVYTELGQYQKAIDDFTQSILLDKYNAGSAYDNRGTVYYRLGRYQSAIEDYNESIKLKADNIFAYYNRGLSYLKLGDNASGCSDAQKACELGKCDLLQIAKVNGYCR